MVDGLPEIEGYPIQNPAWVDSNHPQFLGSRQFFAPGASNLQSGSPA
jgi:hypothetical protein